MPPKLKRNREDHIAAGAWLKAIQEKVALSSGEFRELLNKTISEVSLSVGLNNPNIPFTRPTAITGDVYRNYIDGSTIIPFHVKYVAKLIESDLHSVEYAPVGLNRPGNLLLRVFDDPIDRAGLRQLFEILKGPYVCLFFVRRLMRTQDKQLPSLYLIHYNISDCDEKDGTLVAAYTTEQGAHRRFPHKGYAKLAIGRHKTNLIYFVHVEQGRTQPPVSGLLHTSQVIKTGNSFFYGLASGCEVELSDTFIAVRVLWIPCVHQRIAQLPHQITEEHIGRPAWNCLMTYWTYKQPLEDVYLLAPSMLYGCDGKATISVRDVVQDFLDLMDEETGAQMEA